MGSDVVAIARRLLLAPAERPGDAATVVGAHAGSDASAAPARWGQWIAERGGCGREASRRRNTRRISRSGNDADAPAPPARHWPHLAGAALAARSASGLRSGGGRSLLSEAGAIGDGEFRRAPPPDWNPFARSDAMSPSEAVASTGRRQPHADPQASLARYGRERFPAVRDERVARQCEPEPVADAARATEGVPEVRELRV